MQKMHHFPVVILRLIKSKSFIIYENPECTESGILHRFRFWKLACPPFVPARASSMPVPNSPNRTRNHIGRCALFSPTSPTLTRTRAERSESLNRSFFLPTSGQWVVTFRLFFTIGYWTPCKSISCKLWLSLSVWPKMCAIMRMDDGSSESARSLPWVQETLPQLIRRWHLTFCFYAETENFAESEPN